MAVARWKLWSIVILGAAAVVLVGLRMKGEVITRRPAAQDEIVRAVDRFLSERKGTMSGGRIWKVRVPGATASRTEQRVSVPPDFDSIEFNHALAQRLAPFGASVVGTERTKEATVSMHVVTSGTTVYSVLLVTDPNYYTKENTH